MKFISSLLMCLVLLAPGAQAQQDSVFDSYEDYAAFVDQHVMQRDFIMLILRLGGRDEYSQEQLEQTNAQLRGIWQEDFQNASVFREEDLGGGLRQEGRLYWSGTGYAYFYALMHQRENDFVVLSFHLNTNSRDVLDRF
ncbi:MAG: hypothetical protein AAF744_08810 [Pseudomonadota bacterium]